MHPRGALAHASENIGGDVGKLDRGVRGVHLISLRRHDPDQVRWVGLRLSVRQPIRRTPHEIARDF
jgi:hypothetical protein